MKNLTLFLNFIVLFSFGQKEADKWFFGQTAGVDFSTNPPSAVTGSMYTIGGSASVADANGNLLMYTNGVNVWNRLHQVMANGTGLLGNIYLTQPAVILKQPGNSNIYYIFTNDMSPNFYGHRYHVVDMSLAAGNGSVISKNNVLWQGNNCDMTATRHCNGTDWWVVYETYSNYDYSKYGSYKGFRSYSLTATGVDTNYVFSPQVANVVNSASELKISPNGRLMAATNNPSWAQGPMNGPITFSVGTITIHDFNNSTGVITHINTIQTGAWFYGSEFSPDNRLLYAKAWEGQKIYQWQLCGGTDFAINASIDSIPCNGQGDLQLAPDGKIYAARYNHNWLGVINNPNTPGSGCNYTDLGIALPKKCFYGLPNFPNSGLKMFPVSYVGTSTLGCTTASFNFNSPSCPLFPSYTGITWNFGDPLSGAANTSTLFNATHSYSTQGIYNVKIIVTGQCAIDSMMTSVAVGPIITVKTASYSCDGLSSATIQTQGAATQAQWLPGNQTGFVATGLAPGINTVMVSFNSASCSVNQTFNVSPQLIVPVISSVISCNSNTCSVQVSNGSGNYQFLWPTGQTGTTATAVASGAQNLVFTDVLRGCTCSIPFTVTTLPVPAISVTGNTTICRGDKCTLTAVGASSFMWYPGQVPMASINILPQANSSYTVVGTSSNYPCPSQQTVQFVINECTGLSAVEENSAFGFFPNPAGNYLQLVNINATIVKIFTLDGKLLFTQAVGSSAEIDVSGLAEGMYLLCRMNGNSLVDTRRFQVMR